MKSFAFGFFLCLAIYFGYGIYYNGGNNLETVVLRDRIFNIPQKYIVDSTLPFWMPDEADLDDSSGEILLDFTGSELAQEIPGFLETVQGSTSMMDGGDWILMSVLSADNMRRNEKSAFYAPFWYELGQFEGQRSEYIKELGMYKVTNNFNDDYWFFTTMKIDKNKPLPEDFDQHYIASCLNNSSFEGQIHYSCSRQFLIGNIHFVYDITAENIKLIDAYDKFLKRKLEEWLVN